MKHAFQDLIRHLANQRQKTNLKSSSHDQSRALNILKYYIYMSIIKYRGKLAGICKVECINLQQES
jgi:hypothetical protein